MSKQSTSISSYYNDSSVSLIRLLETPWTAARQASWSITNSRSLLTLTSIDLVMPSNHLILYRPLLLLPSIFPSIRVFSYESVLRISITVSASASVLPMNIQDWFPLGLTGWISLQSRELFKSLLQHHSSKASILQRSAFSIVQLSHLYMTTGKTIALTRWTFVGKVMSLLFNKLSRLVITFLTRSKRLLISWLQSLTICSDFGAPQNKASVFIVSPCIWHEVMAPDAMIFVF